MLEVKKLLLVCSEDNPQVRNLLELVLDELSIDWSLLSTKDFPIEISSAQTPIVFISEINEKQSLSDFIQIRSTTIAQPLLLICPSESQDLIDLSIDLKVEDIATTPFSKDELSFRIRKLLSVQNPATKTMVNSVDATLLDQVNMNVVITDTDGIIQYINPTLLNFMGYSSEELLLQHVEKLGSGKMPDLFFKEMWDVLTTGHSWQGEYQNKKKNGTIYWEGAIISPLKEKNGQLKGFLSIQRPLHDNQPTHYHNWLKSARLSCLNECRNILLHHQDETSLYQEFIHNIVEKLDYELLYIALKSDPSTKELKIVASCGRANNYLKQLDLSFDENDVSGRGPVGVSIRTRQPSFTSVDAPHFKPWKHIAESHNFRSIVCIPLITSHETFGTIGFYSKEDSYSEDELNFLKVFASELAEGIQNIRQVNEKKAQHLRLKALSDELQTITENKTWFLANMSHEIRTPLNAIIGFSRLIRDSEENVPQVIGEYLEHIDTAGQLLTDIIGNTLDLSKIESGKMEVEMIDLDLHEFIKKIYHTQQSLAISKQLDYTYQLDPNVPQWIKGDRTLLNQIVVNLIGNAMKFTEPGKKLSLSLKNDHHYFLIEVKDEGIGMTKEQLAKVFQPFEQADASTRRQFGGTGLGLTITKKIIELLNGELLVESKSGEGSKFTIRLPLIHGEEKVVKPIEKNYRKDLSAIVVDDNPINLTLMKSVMRNLNVTCQTCVSGQDFLEQVDDIKPDFILLDLHMPHMDGFEVLERMPTELIPITFILSADVIKESKEACKKMGVSTFLSKPLDMDQLIDVLSYHFPAERTLT